MIDYQQVRRRSLTYCCGILMLAVGCRLEAQTIEQTFNVPINAVTSIDSSFALTQATFDVQGDYLVPTIDSTQFELVSVSAKIDAWGATLQWYDFTSQDSTNQTFYFQSQINVGVGGAAFPQAAGHSNVNTGGLQSARYFGHALVRDDYEAPAGTLGSALAIETRNFYDDGSEGDGTTRLFWRETIVVSELGPRQANRILLLANLGLEITYELQPLVSQTTSLTAAMTSSIEESVSPQVFMVSDGDALESLPDDLLAGLPEYVVAAIPEPGSMACAAVIAALGLLRRRTI